MGFKEIVSIALGSGIFKALTPKENDVLLDMNELWKHSIGVGLSSKQIDMKTKKSMEESMMLVGLLHDVGKILFLLYFQADYAEVLVKHQTEHIPLHVIEHDMLEITHAEMAYLLMKQWNFPDNISIPIRYHHSIAECPFEYLSRTMTVHLADYICHQAKIGHSANMIPEKKDEIISALGLSQDQLNELINSMDSSRQEVDGFLEAMS